MNHNSKYKCPTCCDTGCVLDESRVQTADNFSDMLVPCPKCNPPKREGGVWSEVG